MRTFFLHTRVFGCVLASILLLSCSHGRAVEEARVVPTPKQLAEHCDAQIGAPRVMQLQDNVWVALGYDLANTILIQTPEGNVVIDPGMSPRRSQEAREALLKRSPGKTRALIFTHSHIDHVGGASAWAEPGTEIWAAAPFRDHFLKQYALFQRAEMRRGAGQFGEHVGEEALACSALGRRIDLEAARTSGARMPTHTLSGAVTLDIGGTRIELHEAHGETHDQLFVWLPEHKLLMPGDNYYHSFPNLYTIRGTTARPVNAWIESLDRMRALRPVVLVPSHTSPVTGEAEIAERLTDYRDAIQWVRDETVRGANQGKSMAELTDRIRLPRHLAEKPYLAELYGQVDWSVRAIYGNNLGWFDERPEALYPVPMTEAARREVVLFGGEEKVLGLVDGALEARDFRWAAHLLAKLREASPENPERLNGRLAAAYQGIAAETLNTNGRGYLLESLYRLENGYQGGMPSALDEKLLREIPVETFFTVMTTRLIPAQSGGVHERLTLEFSDTGRTFHLTVRNGVAELKEGTPLPGSPEPVATLRLGEMTWRRLALKMQSPAIALAVGELEIDGSLAKLLAFLGRFDQEL